MPLNLPYTYSYIGHIESWEHNPDKSILQVFRKTKVYVFKGSEKIKIFS